MFPEGTETDLKGVDCGSQQEGDHSPHLADEDSSSLGERNQIDGLGHLCGMPLWESLSSPNFRGESRPRGFVKVTLELSQN